MGAALAERRPAAPAIHCAGPAVGPRQAARVAAAARGGGVILFPTDTLYGLGVDPLSTAGLAALFRLKGRPRGKPVPVLIADASLAGRFAAAVPASCRVLMDRFWPGPLTLLFPAAAGLPPGVCARSATVALRVPGSALCRSVLQAAGGWLTGTSANRAGASGTGNARVALAGLGGRVALVVDAGTLPPSPASTLVDATVPGVLRVLREGAVPAARIRRAWVAAGGPGAG